MDAILEIQHLSKRYGDHVAVDDLSFSVPRGSVFGLLGPNGAGKTTTIRMIMRIIASDSGTVLLDGEPVLETNLLNIEIKPQCLDLGFHVHLHHRVAIERVTQETRQPRHHRIRKIRLLLENQG